MFVFTFTKCGIEVGRECQNCPQLNKVFTWRTWKAESSITLYTWYLSFFYTTTFWGLEILHSKVRKFATKIASRQNSVNLRQKLPCDKNCVNHHHTAEIDTMCVKLHTVWKITHCVYNYTLSVKLHAECKITQSVKLHAECKITQCV